MAGVTKRKLRPSAGRREESLDRVLGISRRKPQAMDYAILFLVLFLVGFGLVMIYSTSSYKGSLYMNDAAYWLKKQAFFAVAGSIAMVGVSKIDYHSWTKRLWENRLLYFGPIVMLVLTIFKGTVANGSRRWINIGPIGFQPSEIAKVTTILFLAAYINKHTKEMRNWKGVGKVFLLTLPTIILVAISNLSTSIILFAIAVIMIFVGTPVYKIFFGIGGVGIVGGAFFLMTQSYRVDRFTTWLDPESSDKGHQTMQGLYAIGSGGLFGKGLGQSMQKMGFVPEPYNDMIFSIVCEELGLFGAICVIVLFFLLLWRFMMIALNAEDLYGSMIVIGVIAHIGLQVFVNIGVVTNTIPNTGVPLPFISYGGSSLVFLLVEIGLVLSVSRYIRIRD